MEKEGHDIEAQAPPEADESEVRAEELTRGTAQPIGQSAFSDEVVEELTKPLDPNRVRRREGRGNRSYEYLAGHDVKRRANELFGFGNWGHTVRNRELLAAVEVENKGREGWHVGYATTVRVWVRGGFHTEGVGYGDGVEYGPAARVQACELAIKESETDALKRAFTDLGDQFGLILYAKDDEKKRIERDRNQPTGVVHRQEEAMQRDPAPKDWTEIQHAVEAMEDTSAPGITDFWIPQAFFSLYGVETAREMKTEQRKIAGQKLAGAVSAILDLPDFPPPTREKLQEIFATYFDGAALEGPPWRLSPSENDLPTAEDWIKEAENVGEEQEKIAEETITGPPK